MASVGQIAEGVNTTRLVKDKEAVELDVYMLAHMALYATMFEERSIAESLKMMMLAEQNTDVEFTVNAND